MTSSRRTSIATASSRRRAPPCVERCGAVGALLLALLCTTGSAAPVATIFDPIIEQELERRALPALSVAIYRRGEMVFARGYGLADLELGQAADERTVFPIGSVAKQFTAAAIMRLAERGTLSLDQTVASLLPGSPERWRGITIEELLRHTAGVREPFTIPAVQGALHDLSRPASELLATLRREPLAFTPGERWGYSNANYLLLAGIVEQLTGVRYERFLEQEFFRPNGLDLWHCTPWPDGPNEARGYLRDGDVVRPAPPENMSWARGDGGLCASSIDLVRWAHALGTGKVVSRASLEKMSSRRATRDGTTPDYGFGLSLIDLEGRTRLAHNGAIGGFSATLAWYPESEVAIALLSNLAGVPLEALEKRLARAIFGVPAPAQEAQPIGAATRRKLAGSYDIGVFEIRLVEREGRLHLEMPPPGWSGALVHLGEGRFVGESEPEAIALEIALEEPGTLKLLMANMHWYGRRIEPQATGAARAQRRPE